jgi:hypothetical protein
VRHEVKVGPFESLDDLGEEGPGSTLGIVVGLEILVELSSRRQLHDYEDVCGGVEDFVELDDVGMVKGLVVPDLPLDLHTLATTFDIIFLFFILTLLMILTATLAPVSSCRPST